MGRRVKRYRKFVMLSDEVLDSVEWQDLTSSEMIVYIYIKRYYNGANNGEIQLHYAAMNKIMANDTLSKAIKGLEQKGWIEKTHLGGMFRYQSKYKITGKHDKI